MKPNFLLIGAAKSGTTSLCALLGSHPDIFMTDPKETNFFAYDGLFNKGPQWYESLYRNSSNFSARGEGSPLYTLRNIYPEAARRIAEYDPTLKLIFIVRHPLERIESGWLEMRSWGDETVHADFNRALKLNRDWLVDSTNYWLELERYRHFFSDEQILVLFFEDFVKDRQAVLCSCCEFLGVDTDIELDTSTLHLNPSNEKRVRRRSISMLRSIPGIGMAYSLAKKLVPEVLRVPIRNRILNAPAIERPRWTPESQRWVVDELRSDAHRLLQHCGKQLDFWDLDTPRIDALPLPQSW